MDIVINQELLKHLTSSDEKVAVTSLASELEGVLGRRLGPVVFVDDGHFYIGHDRHL